jgi:hypothetical protein
LKYSKSQFNQDWYRLWELDLLLPEAHLASVFNIKFHFEGKNPTDYSRICLKASSVSDALERACFAVSYRSGFRPEDIHLHSVYDEEDNLLWIDEPYYDLIQKKHEFRGMERREFLIRFGSTSAAILFGLCTPQAHGIIPFAFFKKNISPKGEQLYTTSGVYTWTPPAGVKSFSVVCIGGGGAAGTGYGAGSGGGGLGYANNVAINPGDTISAAVGAAGKAYATPPTSNGGNSSFGSSAYGYGGTGGVSGTPGTGGSYSGTGGGSGGSGGAFTTTSGYLGGSGGGGAGGYSGAGGTGGSWAGTTVGAGANGQGGAGGGGAGGNAGTGGGGVGIYGPSANGTGGTAGGWYNTTTGVVGPAGGSATGGSGGSGSNGYGGGAYGGGTCSATGAHAGSGVVRIIWGTGRSFPNNAI